MGWQHSGDRQQRPKKRSEGAGPERRWSAVARDGGGGGTPAIWGGRAAACDSVEDCTAQFILECIMLNFWWSKLAC
uniref:Uncharacterized protein n=1 Tax=Oryza sativa subsp. japonica TaxID=39947 RepID=Q6ZAL4_ORYSJ|nr:hypothetical protein [Oryza sativa Japonica Group]